jgi:2-keto-3-deoxy-L-rhamnonate aldolase RhmA
MFTGNNQRFRDRLKRGQPLGVFWMSTGSIAVLELAARAKPDAVVVDAQHGLWDRLAVEHAVGLACPHVPVLVRTAENTPVAISQALDAGAEGVIIPLIDNADAAARAVAAARFPPHGVRSGGGVRPVAQGFANYYADANAGTVVGVMIETQRGVDNVRAIAGTAGVDFVLIGSGDLAISLGTFPQPDPRFDEACRTVLDACNTAGIPCGIYTNDAEGAIRRSNEGYALVVAANDIAVIAAGFSAAMNKFRAAAADGQG